MALRAVAVAAVLVAAVVAFLRLRGSEVATGPVPVADGLDFPVGAPDGHGYYDAQPFGQHHHLGGDWNGVGGGDSDLGDPVTAIADGVVRYAGDRGGGWGNVVRVEHRLRSGGRVRSIESVYAHLDRVDVEAGATIRRGQRLGTIGTAHGRYKAHLHLELRSTVGADLGGGYASDRRHHLDPTAFIRAHRPR